jgi:predicted RNA-binding Zn ribbon-like protein
LLDRPPAVDEHKLAKAMELREAVQRVGESIVAQQSPSSSDIARINVAASGEAIPQLSADAATTVWVSDGLEAALSRIARDAIELFSGPLRNRIRICANPKCLGLFVDESRPGLRRWCSMTTCGDMAKKARFRKKAGSKTSAA